MKTISILLAVLVATALASCGSTDNSLTEEDRADITAQHEKATGPIEADPGNPDWEAFGDAHYFDDATWYPPNGQPIVGRDAIVASVMAWPPLTKFQVEDLKVEGTHDLTYILYGYDITMQVNDSTSVNETGRGIELWRKGDEGWRCFADIWNTDMPLPQ
jgi:ketosteroid isomerase-like protein